jgi:hypothetical protein
MALLLVPEAVPAATSIGQLDPGTPSGSCAGTSSWVQSSESGTPSYVVPAGRWVVVSWSHRSNSASGRELGLRIWHGTATVGTYTLIGAGALRVLAPNGINTFYDRIPVMGGDLLGLRVGNPPGPFPDIGGGASCAFTAAGNTVRYSVLTSEPSTGGDVVLPGALVYRLNVTAHLEPDADADGYGDETQDACPGAAGTSAGCAPVAPGPGPDKAAPTARLSSKRDSIADGRVSVWVTASEAAMATATGTLRIGSHAQVHRLRKTSKAVTANKRVRLTLRLAKKTKRAAMLALRRKRLRASISVLVQDAAGNGVSVKRRVPLKR